MKLKNILISGIFGVFGLLFIVGIASADMGSGINTSPLMRLDGTDVLMLNSSWDLGSEAIPIHELVVSTIKASSTITDTLTVTATTTSPLLLDDGTVSAPAYSWMSDSNSGLYRIGADNIGMTLGGSLIYDFGATSFDIGGMATVTLATGNIATQGDLDLVGLNLQNTTGTLNVSKSGSMTTILGTFNVDEAVTFDSTANIAGNLDVGGMATITASTGNITSEGDIDLVGLNIQNTTGTLNVSKSGSMTTILGTFNVDEATTLDTTLSVTGASTLSTLLVTGAINASSTISMANDTWLRALNNADSSYINLFKINTSDEIDVGATLNTGPIEFEADAGAVTAMNMSVSATPTAGDEMSITFSIDSNSVLTVKALADSSGGVNSEGIEVSGYLMVDTDLLYVDATNDMIGIGTTTPASLLHIHNDTATSTLFIDSGGAGLGGEIILEDTDGAGCTEITALDGTLTAQTVTCPTN